MRGHHIARFSAAAAAGLVYPGLGRVRHSPAATASFANAGGLLSVPPSPSVCPELQFFIFYASFSAGVGFDVMLRNYGVDARCANNMDSDEPIGINGWYATGQMYAYIQGAIGIAINIGFQRPMGDFSIGAAAVLQARLPNPSGCAAWSAVISASSADFPASASLTSEAPANSATSYPAVNAKYSSFRALTQLKT